VKPLNLQGGLGDFLAVIAGASLPLAFAPYSVFPIAVLSPALLFLLWQKISTKRAFWRGWLYGVSLFSVGTSWVYISFYQFGGVSLVVAIILTALFVLVLATYLALLGATLTRFFPQNSSGRLLIVLPAAWTLMEWLRGWLFTGFPWLSLGYSQIDSPLNGFAPLLGVYGVSWIVALTASLLILAFQSHWKKQLLALAVLVTIWGSGWLLSGILWVQVIDKPLKISLIQGNVPQEFKWLEGNQVPSMRRYLKLSQENRDADIIIWPETAIPLFYNDLKIYMPYFLETLAAEHHNYDTDFLIGIPMLKADGRYFNSVVSIGKEPGVYYKQHLVPFGEYIPLQIILGNLLKLLNVPMSEFSAGNGEQTTLKSAGQVIGVSICYEDAFGELVRKGLPAASLLVNVSNDAWFGESIAPYQHLEMARMRALETGRYLLRATNTGISAVINAKGKITTEAPQFKIITLRANAQPYQGKTPYVRFGNAFILSFLLLLIIGYYLFLKLRRAEIFTPD
jgi:apolipoprotein N-acyltransferase